MLKYKKISLMSKNKMSVPELLKIIAMLKDELRYLNIEFDAHIRELNDDFRQRYKDLKEMHKQELKDLLQRERRSISEQKTTISRRFESDVI
jgi:hypothetical protein